MYYPSGMSCPRLIRSVFAITAVYLLFPCMVRAEQAYKYWRLGQSADATNATPRAGFALMGGGKDLDEAFRWLCERAGGGDLLVLRATGDDDYNPYIQKLCKLNSVATLILPTRESAGDPFVARTILAASALFIAGGDQANYINFWMGTPVQSALNADIARGIPIGGTSAGLAVLGEYAYTAQGDKPDDPNLDGKTALGDPFGPRVTLVRGFLNIPALKGIVTDSHFARRNRMGRLLVFVARLNEPDGKPVPPLAQPGIRGLGIEERAAVLLEPDGNASVVGNGSAYLVDPIDAAFCPGPGKPFENLVTTVHKFATGHAFNLKSATADDVSYKLSVKEGKLNSTQAGGSIY